MDSLAIENTELDVLLEAVFERYGYDFRHYARASLQRRIRGFMEKHGFKYLREMMARILADKSVFETLVYAISVSVTEMFRDPLVYLAIREEVTEFLKTYPFIRIWHAGCASGEEVYSLAIVLSEAGLYDRCQIYATDMNSVVLEKAKQGIYPAERLQEYTRNYRLSGGREPFSTYYHAKYDSVIMNAGLKKRILFANHNLVTDSVFGEMNLVLCRNVLIYFDQHFQNRALRLFYDSLVHKGYLCLGTKETIRYSEFNNRFKEIFAREKIYQRQ